MPQLDTSTFRGQSTWLRVVFVVLYRTRTGEILPKLSQIVKMRSKKRDRTRGDATQYDGERTQVENGYSGRLGKAAGSSYGLLQERTEIQSNWVKEEGNKRNQSKGINKAMEGYRSYRMGVKLSSAYLNKKLVNDGKKEIKWKGKGKVKTSGKVQGKGKNKTTVQNKVSDIKSTVKDRVKGKGKGKGKSKGK